MFYEKLSPLSYSKLSNINSLAVPKRGSDLPPSVGRSGSALGNESAIDARVSWYVLKSVEKTVKAWAV